MTSQQLITGWEKKQELRLSMDHFIESISKCTKKGIFNSVQHPIVQYPTGVTSVLIQPQPQIFIRR